MSASEIDETGRQDGNGGGLGTDAARPEHGAVSAAGGGRGGDLERSVSAVVPGGRATGDDTRCFPVCWVQRGEWIG